MKLYNSLIRKVENFEPIEADKVKLFVCGPTVYDFSHLGHAKTYIQLDVLARVLKDQGFDVFYLQNITDIDDKIINRAKENGISWEQLREKFESEYLKDMTSLGNTSVTQYARATDYIEDIIRQVKVLLDKGHAYKIADGIYFEVATFPGYGKLSGRTKVTQNDAQTRIDHSEEKKGWNDFCLWKFSKPGEPVWDASFGDGRPGWHIEDTAITEHFFGPQYDIHGGAVDLIFPHHEAEITQMESASGKVPFVRHWVHTGFLNIDDAKMSKSKGNFFTIREVLEKGHDPMSVRMLTLQSHYRATINFSWDLLEAAKIRLQSYQTMADRRFQSTGIKDIRQELQKTQKAIREALADDLNTPQALAVLSELEVAIDNSGISLSAQEAFNTFIDWIDSILGLRLGSSIDITEKEKQLIKTREAARRAKDWSKSDELRDELGQQGIGVRDTGHGQIWFRL
ncbi:MAG: cysteine--tRNA ligase [Patescibacteria group bacterium]